MIAVFVAATTKSKRFHRIARTKLERLFILASSKLQNAVREYLIDKLGETSFRENYYPDWLLNDSGRRLELDFYIESLSLAIEVQGEQHFSFNPYFHKNYLAFEKQISRDALKRLSCLERGITLLEIVEINQVQSLFTLLEFIDGEDIAKRRDQMLAQIMRPFNRDIEYYQWRVNRLEQRITERSIRARNNFDRKQIAKIRIQSQILKDKIARRIKKREKACHAALMWLVETWQQVRLESIKDCAVSPLLHRGIAKNAMPHNLSKSKSVSM